MRKSVFLYTIAIAAALLFVAFWLSNPKASAPKEQATNEVAKQEIPTPSADVLPTNSTQQNTASNNTIFESQNPPTDIETSYRQRLITKGQAIQETVLEENKQPQDFYGKVIDQYGQPIMGVAVAGELILNTEIYGAVKPENYASKTDAEGLFQFIGLEGAKFGVRISKDGYKYGDRGEGFKGPVGPKTSPTDRAILAMWKLRGAEPLIRSG